MTDHTSVTGNHATLTDLLFDGNFRAFFSLLHNIEPKLESSSHTETSTSTSSLSSDILKSPAIRYIDSDWNIFQLTYEELLQYSCQFCEAIIGVNNDDDDTTTTTTTTTTTQHRIEIIADGDPIDNEDPEEDVIDDNRSIAITISSNVCVIFGDCAQWTPVLMIAANMANFAFYFVQTCDQLTQAFRDFESANLSLHFTVICHRYRFAELRRMLTTEDDRFEIEEKIEIVSNHYLIRSRKRKVAKIANQNETVYKNIDHLLIAYLINTSGTTQNCDKGDDREQELPTKRSPKYIFVPHDSIVRNVIDFKRRFSLDSRDCAFIASPYTFDPSICDIFLALSAWSCVYIASSVIRNSPRSVRRIFRQYEITYTTMTPSLWRRFDSSSSSCWFDKLRYLNFGGEPSPPIRHIVTTIISRAKNVQINNLYGLTEMSAWASIFCLNDALDSTRAIVDRLRGSSPLSCTSNIAQDIMPIFGSALLDTEISLCADSAEGEIEIESRQRRCLIHEPNSSVKWIFRSRLKTGDRAIRIESPDGGKFIYFLRRECEADFVKLQGVKCCLPLIESLVMQRFGREYLCGDPNHDRCIEHCIALVGDWHEWKHSIVDLVLVISSQNNRYDDDDDQHRQDNCGSRSNIPANRNKPHHQAKTTMIKQAVIHHLRSNEPPLRNFAFRCHVLRAEDSASIFSVHGKLDRNAVRKLLANSSVQQLAVSSNRFPRLDNRFFSIIAETIRVDVRQIEANTDKRLREFGIDSIAALQITLRLEETFLHAHVRASDLFEMLLERDIASIVRHIERLMGNHKDAIQAITNDNVSEEDSNKPKEEEEEMIIDANRSSASILADVSPSVTIVSRNFRTQKLINLESSINREIENIPLRIEPLWSIFMDECVDATPLVISFADDRTTYLIAASHSGMILAIDPFSDTPDDHDDQARPSSRSYKKLWSTQMESRIEASPVASYDGALIFVADYSGAFCALQTTTGRSIWRFRARDAIKCSATLIPSNNRNKDVNNDDHRSGMVAFGSYDHHLYCLRQYDGRLCFDIDLGSAIFASPTYAITKFGPQAKPNSSKSENSADKNCDNRTRYNQLLCCTLSGSIVCLDLASTIIDDTGPKIRWKQSLVTPVFSTPLIVANRTAIIGTTRSIVCLWLRDGAIRWTIALDGPVFSSPVAFRYRNEKRSIDNNDDNNEDDPQVGVIFGTHSTDNVICVRAECGERLWCAKLDSPVYSNPFLMLRSRSETNRQASVSSKQDDHVSTIAIIVESESVLHAFDCQTGNRRTIIADRDAENDRNRCSMIKMARVDRYRMSTIVDRTFSSPIVFRDHLFIGSRDSCLHCFRFRDV